MISPAVTRLQDRHVVRAEARFDSAIMKWNARILTKLKISPLVNLRFKIGSAPFVGTLHGAQQTEDGLVLYATATPVPRQ